MRTWSVSIFLRMTSMAAWLSLFLLSERYWEENRQFLNWVLDSYRGRLVPEEEEEGAVDMTVQKTKEPRDRDRMSRPCPLIVLSVFV